MEYLDLYRLAETSVEMLQVSAGNRNVTLSLEGSSCIVKANKQMMEELLYNLCDNAVRYNNRGGHVDVKVGQEEGRPMLEVKDTGIGI
ncbi:ATP-binding protein, partial [Escherichia coli]